MTWVAKMEKVQNGKKNQQDKTGKTKTRIGSGIIWKNVRINLDTE